MAQHTKNSSIIVKEYLQRFPNLPNLTLAQKIFNEHSLLFSSVESVRNAVRYYRGAMGKRHAKTLIDKSHVKEKGFGAKNPFNLPASYAETRQELKLPTANNNVLIISDIHIPYHDNEALTLAIQYGKEHEVNTILINGDLLDFALISRFEKNPKSRSVREEFDICRMFLEVLRSEFPTADIFWLKGNHDIRYEKWLYLKAPEIFDDPYFMLEERLRLSDLKIKILNDDVLIKAGKLNITHGHLLIRGVFAPVNSARGTYLRSKVSTLISHVHNSSEHTEKDMNGGMVTCWSIGCLCTLHPNYDPFNSKHNLGFAHVTIEKGGAFHVINKRIHDGKIL